MERELRDLFRVPYAEKPGPWNPGPLVPGRVELGGRTSGYWEDPSALSALSAAVVRADNSDKADSDLRVELCVKDASRVYNSPRDGSPELHSGGDRVPRMINSGSATTSITSLTQSGYFSRYS